MSALLHADRHTPALIALHRHYRDFTDDEMACLDRMQELIAAAYRYRAALDRATARISALYAGTPDAESVDHERRLPEAPTRREAEVLALMAAGWTNVQIATRLQITERTVRKHLSAVYEKAHLPGRAAAATWWVQHREDFTR
jgi:DNA-binding NarL/FixJ family response regulator